MFALSRLITDLWRIGAYVLPEIGDILPRFAQEHIIDVRLASPNPTLSACALPPPFPV
jgi:hypothetical protein